MALELGPCQVAYGTSGSETDLGKTFGGVTVRISDDSVDLKSDQFGTSAEDTVITGTNVEVELALAELDLATMATALGQTLAGDAVPGENKVGTSLLAESQSLKLTKYVGGTVSTDAADEITFPAAAPISNVELTYDAENQRVMRLTFKCFPAAVTANWGAGTTSEKTVYYYFGDETATS
jgi:hypothetical protein